MMRAARTTSGTMTAAAIAPAEMPLWCAKTAGLLVEVEVEVAVGLDVVAAAAAAGVVVEIVD